jgi:putative transposase
MEAAFCVETLQEALAKHGKPQIFNTRSGLAVHRIGAAEA